MGVLVGSWIFRSYVLVKRKACSPPWYKGRCGGVLSRCSCVRVRAPRQSQSLPLREMLNGTLRR